MRRSRGLAAAVSALLAGCSGADENADGNRSNVTDARAVAADLARVEIRPGLWELSSEILSAAQPGLPPEFTDRMKGPRGSVRHCITPEEAARPDANFLAGRRSGQCSYRDFAMREGRISGAMTCRDPRGVETRARMSGTHAPERFEMRMDMETPGIGGGILAVIVRQSGRRIGDCTREEGETKR